MKKANTLLLMLTLLVALFLVACRATDCGCP